jgi:hypothetical protein
VLAVVAAGAFTAPAWASYAPKLAVTSDPSGTTTLSFSQSTTDDSTAAMTFYVPSDFLATLGGRAEGDSLGTAVAKVIATDLGGSTLSLSGSVTQARSTTTVSVAGATTPLSDLGARCTGTPTHSDFWILNLAGSGQTLQLPMFVDQVFPDAPLGSAVSFTIAVCLPPPDVPAGTPARAPFGAKLVDATLRLTGVFSVIPSWYIWHLQATPYVAGTGNANTAGSVEAESQDRSPQDVSLSARVDRRTGQVVATGKVKQGGKGVTGAKVQILAGNKALASVTSGPGGSYRAAFKTAARSLTATVAVAVRTLPSCVQPIRAPLPCVSATVGGFVASSPQATVKQ